MIGYRREIDGLRAVALLPVIFFHAGFSAVPGGYVGVDVFFVISGFLITSIIVSEKEAGTFSLVNFYERRVRRIFPALFLTLLLCIPFAWLWLLPRDLKDFSESLVSVPLFSSNFLFWRESGYFDRAAEFKPLIHTWSLAVEEQYYLLFPLFTILIWRLGRKWLVALLVAVFVTSLSLAEWAAYERPSAAFFLLPTRAWELAIGALLALLPAALPIVRWHRAVGEIASIAGLTLIGFSVFAFDAATPFPSVFALLPTLGAALVILFATTHSIAGRVLGSRLFVGIGLTSFSAYLFHQPILAFARHNSVTGLSTSTLLALCVLTLALAYLSWQFVERPFRRHGAVRRGPLITLASSFSALFIAIGIYGILVAGGRDSAANVEWITLGEKLTEQGYVCVERQSETLEGVELCDFGNRRSQDAVFLYGDSHADAIARELDRRLLADGRRGASISIDDCSIVPEIVRSTDVATDTALCLKQFAGVLDYIANQSGELIVISRWTFRLFPIPGIIDDLAFSNRAGGVGTEDYREYLAKVGDDEPSEAEDPKRQALRNFLDLIVNSGVKTYLVYPVPEIGWNVAQVNTQYYEQNHALLRELTIDHDEYLKRNRFVLDVFSEYAGRGGIVPIRPEAVFCETFVPGKCAAQIETRPFYIDDNHLSDLGAWHLVNAIFGTGDVPPPPAAQRDVNGAEDG